MVKNERAEIETQRDENVKNLANFKKEIIQGEKNILKLLAEANEDTILDNVELIETLEKSQTTSVEIKIKIEEWRIISFLLLNI